MKNKLTLNEVCDMCRAMRESGYAVIVYTPSELKGADSGRVEDEIISQSWHIIDELSK